MTCAARSAITSTGNAAVPSVPLRRIDRPAASPAPARIRTESRRSVHPAHRPRPTPPKIARNPVTHLLDKPHISTLLSNMDSATRPATRRTAAPTAIRHSPGRGRAPGTKTDTAIAYSNPKSTSYPSLNQLTASRHHRGTTLRANHQTGRQENGLTLVGTPSLGADPATRRFRPAP